MLPHSISLCRGFKDKTERRSQEVQGELEASGGEELPIPQRGRSAVGDSLLQPGDKPLPGSAGFQGYKLLSMCFSLQCQCHTCVSNLLGILGEAFRRPFVWGSSFFVLHRNSGSWVYGKCGLNLGKLWRTYTSQPEKNNSYSTVRVVVIVSSSSISDSSSFKVTHFHSATHSVTHSLTLLLTHFLSVSVHTPTSSFFHLQSDITSSNEVLTFELSEMDLYPLIDASFLAPSWPRHVM